MKKIEIDQDKLIKYIYQHCQHFFYNTADGESCYRKVDKETCNLHAFANDLHCPFDCPRLNTKEYACNKGLCSRVKAVLKTLKA